MTGSRSLNPAAQAAARQIEEFGYSGWHLILSQDYDPASDAVAGDADRVERQMVQADGYATEDLPARDDGLVFLMTGEPRPKVGDGLVALTRYWRIERVSVVQPGGHEAIYAVSCV